MSDLEFKYQCSIGNDQNIEKFMQIEISDF